MHFPQRWEKTILFPHTIVTPAKLDGSGDGVLAAHVSRSTRFQSSYEAVAMAQGPVCWLGIRDGDSRQAGHLSAEQRRAVPPDARDGGQGVLSIRALYASLVALIGLGRTWYHASIAKATGPKSPGQ
ncbi:MAG: hypothetical protein OXE94_05815 [Aestuariivita sp.]|nr:hypothetical protein [Aestuariivita sp.]MCY4203650.1 hypothetical protein [Aestuariivita sp.]